MSKQSNRTFLVAVVLIALGIFLIFSVNHFAEWSVKIKDNDFDKFGEFIGGVVGTFVSLIGVGLIFLTYRTQTKELRATKEIAAKQNQTQQIQQFESTFFNLVSLHHQIVNSIDEEFDPFKNNIVNYPINKYKGRDFFKELAKAIEYIYTDIQGAQYVYAVYKDDYQKMLKERSAITILRFEIFQLKGLEKLSIFLCSFIEVIALF